MHPLGIFAVTIPEKVPSVRVPSTVPVTLPDGAPVPPVLYPLVPFTWYTARGLIAPP